LSPAATTADRRAPRQGELAISGWLSTLMVEDDRNVAMEAPTPSNQSFVEANSIVRVSMSPL
jgi:hypothetical protein